MCYRIFPRSQPAERKPGCDLLQHGTAGAVAHASATRRVVPRPSPLRSRSSGRSAALPRDGRESRRRETGDHMPGRRCLHDFAGGAVVKMPSLQLRERLLPSQRGPTVRCLLWPGWLNDVRCWARAQCHVASTSPRRRRSLRYSYGTGCGCRLRAQVLWDPCNEFHFTYGRNCPELGP